MRNHFTVSELAEYLNFKKSYIYKLVHEGKLVALKPFGKTLYFDKDKIDKIFRAKETFSLKQAQRDANTYSTLNK
jgi:excisionase family DNA binding protein